MPARTGLCCVERDCRGQLKQADVWVAVLFSVGEGGETQMPLEAIAGTVATVYFATPSASSASSRVRTPVPLSTATNPCVAREEAVELGGVDGGGEQGHRVGVVPGEAVKLDAGERAHIAELTAATLPERRGEMVGIAAGLGGQQRDHVDDMSLHALTSDGEIRR